MFLSKEIDEKLIMAFELYNKELCEALPTDEELKDITFSEVFEKKMQKLISLQKKSYFYLINTVGKRVAIIVLALIISLTATTFSVKALRETVIEFITETFAKFTKVSVQTEKTDIETEFVKTSPQYIPEGYAVQQELDFGQFYQIIYINKEDTAINYFQEFCYRKEYHANTENVGFEKIFVNSYEGIKYTKNGINTVIFADENYLYTIYGQVSFDELIKIAESIKTE